MPDVVACFTYVTAERQLVVLYLTVSATEPQFVWFTPWLSAPPYGEDVTLVLLPCYCLLKIIVLGDC